MKRGTIAFIGNFNIDQVNASGKRIKGLADAIFKDYDVIFIGCSEKKHFLAPIELKKGYSTAFFPTPTNIWKKLSVKKYLSFTLEILSSTPELKGVVSYGSPVLSLYVFAIQKWCKKRNIIFISDVVDMIFKNGKGGIFDLVKFIDTKYLKERIVPKSDGIIAISSNIKNFYKKNNYNKIIIIPPITKRINLNLIKNANKAEIINIVYAGVPFNFIENIPKALIKDRLDWSIELVNKVVDRGIKIEFNIYGLTKDEFLYSLPEYKGLLKNATYIHFHGKVNQKQVEEKIKLADFTILNRDKTEVTEAGFPTKFSESLCIGTPVITTNTSDIKVYLKEGENGLLLDFGVTENNINKLYTVLSNRQLINKMKLYCETNYPFEPDKYRLQIESLLK